MSKLPFQESTSPAAGFEAATEGYAGAQGFVPGTWQLIDTIEVTGAAVSTVEFSSTGDGDQLHDVNGDVDEFYMIEGTWIPIANNEDLYLNPNGVTTAQRSVYIQNPGGSLSSANIARMLLSRTFTSTVRLQRFNAKIFPKTGLVGRGMFSGQIARTSGTSASQTRIGGQWIEAATNITSLELESETASGIDVGSIFRLFRRKRPA